MPVRAIARALGIGEIRTRRLRSLEGALLTQPERRDGMILVNGAGSARRQRFTIGHELGHYLNPLHRSDEDGRFACTGADLRFQGEESAPADPRVLQEIEANRFAIELLTPRHRLGRHLAGEPRLEQVIALASAFDISREAAARRYLERHAGRLAVIFSEQGRLRYFRRGRGFPYIALEAGQSLPHLPGATRGERSSELEEVDPADWLARPGVTRLRAQALRQQGGFGMVLLVAAR
ncbi:ImmA/IrrE family metallo-endopeptidase [Oceanibacterium hippocampi]|uniref:IrrE N-terminal-like domain-containing protein n=1 Tax=Oceanibacterium hippocampi TaxID=745714 RepID=A0A1Y5TZ21_9PROT|nr:ImmA/IrrE family metallo-endopeptidase [Oceanibacterium hippocampi]SLN72126.1 hypothetical protein OCH7691_03432 [Oceanibacterium hippocampi]